MPLLSTFKHPLQKYHAKFNLSPLLSVLPFVVLSTVMNFSVVPKADKMCGDSSLCCCQGKMPACYKAFYISNEERPLPCAAPCLKPCLCCLDGYNEWPVPGCLCVAHHGLVGYLYPSVYCISSLCCLCHRHCEKNSLKETLWGDLNAAITSC